MAPLFTESHAESLEKSGKFMTWKNNAFVEMKRDAYALDKKLQEKLWNISLDLCKDEKTVQIAENLT